MEEFHGFQSVRSRKRIPVEKADHRIDKKDDMYESCYVPAYSSRSVDDPAGCRKE